MMLQNRGLPGGGGEVGVCSGGSNGLVAECFRDDGQAIHETIRGRF